MKQQKTPEIHNSKEETYTLGNGFMDFSSLPLGPVTLGLQQHNLAWQKTAEKTCSCLSNWEARRGAGRN